MTTGDLLYMVLVFPWLRARLTRKCQVPPDVDCLTMPNGKCVVGPVAGLVIEIDDSQCIVLVQQRLGLDNDVRVTITDVDALCEMLRHAKRVRDDS